EQAEGVEAAVAQGQLVALVVLPETARAARPRGDVDVALRNLGGPVLPGLGLQEVDEVPGREARRTALADVGELPAGLEVLARGRGEDPRAITEIVEHRLDHALGAPVQAAEEDGDVIALGAGEWCGRVGAVRPVGNLHRPLSSARLVRSAMLSR